MTETTYRDSDGATFRGPTRNVPDQPCDECGCTYFDDPQWSSWVACAECGEKY